MSQSDGIPVVKFGAHCHMEEFAHGLLYMNTLRHFAEEEEGNCLRGDSYEGTSHQLRGELSIEIDGQFTPISGITGPLRYLRPNILNVNVFCMHTLRDSATDTFVDPRNFVFGDTFAILTDFNEFMKRVNAAVPSAEQELQSGLVKYIDEDSSQRILKMGIFKKLSCFSFQSEFRLALLPGIGAVRRFEVGSLSDIVMLGRLSDLNGRLRVQVNARGRREFQIRNE